MDTESVSLRDDNNTLLLSKCKHIFPLHPSVGAWKINHLIIRNNIIDKLAGEMFQSLPTVKILELVDNDIGQMNENAFNKLKELTSLKIIQSDLLWVKRLLPKDSKLQELHLVFKEFPNEIFSSVPEEITNITIENTPLANGDPLIIPNQLIYLSYLKLENCSIRGLINLNTAISELKQQNSSCDPIRSTTFSNLKTLILSHNHVTYLGPEIFGNLISLETLQLDHNDLQYVNVNTFRYNTNLSTVDLSHNRLVRIQLNYTKFHKYRVEASFNPISCSSLSEVSFYLNFDGFSCREGIGCDLLLILGSCFILNIRG